MSQLVDKMSTLKTKSFSVQKYCDLFYIWFYKTLRDIRRKRKGQSQPSYVYLILIVKFLAVLALLLFFVVSVVTVFVNGIRLGFVRSISGSQDDKSDLQPACRVNKELDYPTCLSTGYCCGDKEIPMFTPIKRKVTGKQLCTETINVVYMVCGSEKIGSVPVSIKSLALFTQCAINIILFTESSRVNELSAAVQEVITPFLQHQRITWEVKGLSGFIDEDKINASVLNPSATYCTGRLIYLPTMLEATDAIIYLNPDTIFLAPVEYLWETFSEMQSNSQVAAMTADYEDPDLGYYNNVYTVPFVQPLGINAGVVLMHLKNLRLIGWDNHMQLTYTSTKHQIRRGTQDMLNVFFLQKSSLFKLLSCEWNFRHHHCYRDYCNCRNAKRNGISLIQQSSHYLQNGQDADKRHLTAIHIALVKYVLDEQNPEETLLMPLRTKFKRIAEAGVHNCDRVFNNTLNLMHDYLAQKYGNNRKRKYG
ncbi:glucoside xylosyltransferase 2-like [Paramacrobiotus metropolitanus]|uniref:glucoside xylosyltransferase 2-like n=1 Tax=Paramacrobiotus metropolitanus TaxID=2943436 RepID=UPI0024463F59|nr:glucoside xylosyltransferase 2-like [Paramacrobiotus metropolitanus]